MNTTPGRPRTHLAVALLLLIHFVLAVTAGLYKCNAYDEIAHITGGYSYWLLNDYRLHPENGNLTQRWMTLPLLVLRPTFPSIEQDNWHNSDVWSIGQQFLFGSDNPLQLVVTLPRMMIALASVLLGWLVWRWSDRLFGAAGGLVSLVLYAFSPTMLAHSGLATSDLMAALFFLLSVMMLQRMTRVIDWVSVIGGGLVFGGMVLVKTSALLLAPIGLVILTAQVVRGRPMLLRWRGGRSIARPRRRQVLWLAGAVAVQCLVIYLMIWAFHGFRYNTFNDYQPDRDTYYKDFEGTLQRSGAAEMPLRFAVQHRLLPEAFLYGTSHVISHSKHRFSFCNGELSVEGWWYFFPYAFAVKSTTPLLILAAATLIAALARHRRRAWWRFMPLWVLLVVYTAASLTSELNIGHRHLLPIYPVLFILVGGVAGRWLVSRHRLAAVAVALLLVWHVGASLWIYPSYLAYFNELAGGPAQGYRRLVDSSLDWGQDLPALRNWLDEHGLSRQDPDSPAYTPVYLAYFGTGDPETYGIEAIDLIKTPWRDPGMQLYYPLAPGYYCISATYLWNVYDSDFGRWNPAYEQAYRSAEAIVQEFLTRQSDPAALAEFVEEVGEQTLDQVFYRYPRLRFARLCAWLRQRDREPDATAGYSILIYRLDEQELGMALFGEPVEMFPDPRIKGMDRLIRQRQEQQEAIEE